MYFLTTPGRWNSSLQCKSDLCLVGSNEVTSHGFKVVHKGKWLRVRTNLLPVLRQHILHCPLSCTYLQLIFSTRIFNFQLVFSALMFDTCTFCSKQCRTCSQDSYICINMVHSNLYGLGGSVMVCCIWMLLLMALSQDYTPAYQYRKHFSRLQFSIKAYSHTRGEA